MRGLSSYHYPGPSSESSHTSGPSSSYTTAPSTSHTPGSSSSHTQGPFSSQTPVISSRSSNSPGPSTSSTPVPSSDTPGHFSSHNPGPSSHPAESSTSNTAVASSLNARSARIKRNREDACNNQMIQAERMVKRSRVELKAGEPGDNVAVLIPLVDRGRGDPRNILGVIINRDLETNLYRIAVRAGILATGYSRNQFVCVIVGGYGCCVCQCLHCGLLSIVLVYLTFIMYSVFIFRS